jgi:hypothetical protein
MFAFGGICPGEKMPFHGQFRQFQAERISPSSLLPQITQVTQGPSTLGCQCWKRKQHKREDEFVCENDV